MAQESGHLQKTLHDYFQRQASTSSPVEKVICPACELQVPKSKINWHLDVDCKSKKSGRKPAGGVGKSSKAKKLVKAIEEKDKQRARKQAVLSDSEEEAKEVSLFLGYDHYDVKEHENPDNECCESDSDVPYISSSMVETQLSEPEEGTCDGLSLKSTSSGETSPHFSPNCKKSSTPVKKDDRMLVNGPPKIQHTGVALLESEWDSPQSTPEKTPNNKSNMKPESGSSPRVSFSPQTMSGKEVKAMLEKDWSSSSPSATSLKVKTSEQVGKARPGINLLQNCTMKTEVDDGDDFEETTFMINTPRKSPKFKSPSSRATNHSCHQSLNSLSPVSSKSKHGNSNQHEKSNIDSEDEFEKSFEFSTSNKASTKFSKSPKALKNIKENTVSDTTQSVELVDGMTQIGSESDTESDLPVQSQCESDTDRESNVLFSLEKSPSLITRTWCPIPTVSDVGVKKEVAPFPARQLFTSPVKQNLEGPGKETNTESQVRVNISAGVRNSMNQRVATAKDSDSQDEIFDALMTQNSSQENKVCFRTPRKFHQVLKNTGLLQNVSPVISVVTPKKKLGTPSPTLSPLKLEKLSQPDPSTNTEDGAQVTKDPAMYRQFNGYYLENFLTILDTVLGQPEDKKLLNTDDLATINTFLNLSLPARKLYVRLFQRKLKWNRVCKIDYQQICDQEDNELYVNELTYADLLHRGKSTLLS